MSDYLKVCYGEENRPYTSYPEKLAKYLYDKYKMKNKNNLLEIGCGRGEILKSFKNFGLEVEGVDLSTEAREFNKNIKVQVLDIENDILPYPSNSFDIVFSKSVLEHLSNPDRYMKEAFRVLKPKGILLTLVPDWESNYKIYFDDYTHKTPFSKLSLEHILKINDFKEVNVYKFRQLPLLWKYPKLNYLSAMIAPFVPVRTKIKFLRWSRELMLISVAIKP
mgnify:FL=1